MPETIVSTWVCDHCGGSFADDEPMYDVLHRECWENWCCDCTDFDVSECPECGTLFATDYGWYDDYDYAYCCRECLRITEDEGYNENINSYHYSPEKNMPLLRLTESDMPISVGIEVEMNDGHYGNDDTAGAMRDICENLWCEEDCTVSGFEWGYTPMTLDCWDKWTTFEEHMDMCNKRGHTVDYNCGGHIHIGQNILLSRGKWFPSYVRLTFMFELFEDELWTISGRDRGNGNAAFGRGKTLPSVIDTNKRERRWGYRSCVWSADNSPTIEFRIFGGSLDATLWRERVEFCVACCHAAREYRARHMVRANSLREALGAFVTPEVHEFLARYGL